MKKLGFFVAAAALVATPLMAQASPAIMPLSGDESAASEGGGGIVAALLGAGIVAMVVLAATDGNDVPVSG